jgi:predicted small lipoprotein YifL
LHIGTPKIASILFLVAIALSLASCGRRGPLELPPGTQVSCAPVTGTPGDYQSASNAGELSGAGESQSQAHKTCASKAPRPFFLDPLL